jgi:hypothetical protein
VRGVTGWMRAKGMSDAGVECILVRDPCRMLTGMAA